MARSGGRWRPMAPPLGDGIELEPQSQAGVEPQSVAEDTPRSLAEEDLNRLEEGFDRCWSSGNPKDLAVALHLLVALHRPLTNDKSRDEAFNVDPAKLMSSQWVGGRASRRPPACWLHIHKDVRRLLKGSSRNYFQGLPGGSTGHGAVLVEDDRIGTGWHPLVRFAAILAALGQDLAGSAAATECHAASRADAGEGRQRSSSTPGPTCPAHRLGAAGSIQRDLPRRAAPLDALCGTTSGLPQEDALSAPTSLHKDLL